MSATFQPELGVRVCLQERLQGRMRHVTQIGNRDVGTEGMGVGFQPRLKHRFRQMLVQRE
jgi:hypothetical protein